MSFPVLSTKLFVPSGKPNLVSRPRLLQKLDGGLERSCRLTLVSAPAGYGKTTLVRDWLEWVEKSSGSLSDSRKFAWLSLDESDNDLSGFLRYFLAAIQRVEEKVGGQAQGLLSLPSLP